MHSAATPTACVIFNPAARGQKAARLREALGRLSGRCVLRPTRGPGDARVLAAEAASGAFETIVAAGGDGTVNEVLNGICEVPGALDRVRLGVLPCGTVNVFARELRLPAAFADAWRVVEAGAETRIDLPVAEFVGRNGPERRFFLQLGGAGLDARAIELVNWEWKKRVGPLAYVAAGFEALRRPGSRVVARNGHHVDEGELVLFGNGRFYGGEFHVFPAADLRDGRFDVCVFEKADLPMVTRCLLQLLWGRIDQCRGVSYRQADRLHLQSVAQTALELDGENVGHLPAEISLLPRALRVIIP